MKNVLKVFVLRATKLQFFTKQASYKMYDMLDSKLLKPTENNGTILGF